jgi:hypothetical protein
MRLTSIHPGATLDLIKSKTGFPVEASPDLQTSPLPTQEELEIIHEIDPLGVRKLELLAGAARRSLLHEIIDVEEITKTHAV